MKLISWDAHNINDGTNYEAILEAGSYGLPIIDLKLGLRQGSWPLITGFERPGKIIHFDIYIRNTPLATYQKQLAQWFDPDDETPKKLIGEDAGGANDRYIWGICLELAEVPFSAGLHFVVSVQVHGDIMWRETTPSNDSWNITASGQTKVVANNGEMDAYQILKIKPTSTKASGFSYKKFMVIRWEVESAANNYPVDITNNGLDTTDVGKFKANLEDLRVYVDGIEVDRWTDPTVRNSTTKVWINQDFSADIPMTLNGAHNNSTQTILVNEDITDVPNSGIINMGTEVIVYSGKNSQEKSFTDCTRGAKGTTAASHSNNDPVYWIQHDVMIYYGDASLPAPTVDDGYKPMFELSTSLNNSWDFNEFGETAKPNRSAQWQRINVEGAEFYGGDQGSYADPWVDNGVKTHSLFDRGDLRFTNVCGISSANFANGHKRSENKAGWIAEIMSDTGGTEYVIAAPTLDSTWQTWSRNEALTSGATWVSAVLLDYGAGDWQYLEFSDCTLAIVNEPIIVQGAEKSNYELSCKITNNMTQDAVELNFNMSLNEELEFDSDAKAVIYLADDSNQFNALGLVGGPRRDWLPLQPGNNTIQFDDVGTGNVTISFEWEERHYQ